MYFFRLWHFRAHYSLALASGMTLQNTFGDIRWLPVPLWLFSMVCVTVLYFSEKRWPVKGNLWLDGLRYRGAYPDNQEPATDEHVRRLKEMGEISLAVRLRSEIHNETLKEARRRIREL